MICTDKDILLNKALTIKDDSYADETDNTKRRKIYGPNNELLSEVVPASLIAMLSSQFADDGKLD